MVDPGIVGLPTKRLGGVSLSVKSAASSASRTY